MARDDNPALCKSEPHDAASGLSTAARPGESLHKARVIGEAAAGSLGARQGRAIIVVKQTLENL
jgi:hypothetical protein